ncbi:endonuclease/exonuclease/phosphatase family metal-dependent hydrolase [Isoptericola jiangsuensis]|uniref:Endonuclease/exonuclease/phosphatase family metal-dependent hydrolase n=1 Tax=Isoptericola jiangsuensis TaxID=548579 RepID=A0A2A9EWJ2_9MICO|nr:endonuclease/exonuclease/phosphatase family protein [Isoptericola jiangsuensis]PFG42529.1 endonuclease/exonuclease/phosphatase family metal-dependent hydrolase [Isoptericola jiangsuensis]
MNPASRARSELFLLALVTGLVAELVRASGPLLDRAFAQGVTTAATVALVTYVAPAVVVAALTVGRRVSGRVVLLAVALLVAARVALQVLGAQVAAVDLAPGAGEARAWLGLATVALGLGVLVVVAAFVSAPADEPTARDQPPSEPGTDTPAARGSLVARGVTYGLLGSAAVHLLLGTWDAVWRADAAAWVVVGVLSAGTLATAWLLRGRPAGPCTRSLWVLGPYVALGVQVFANPAFVASDANLPLPVAGAALAVATLATGAALSLLRPLAGPLAAAVVLVLGVWVLFLAAPPGPVAAWLLLAVATALPAAGARAVAPLWSQPARVHGTAWLTGTAAAVGLGTALPLLVYQLDYDVPLPFPNGLAPVVAALAVALPAVVQARRGVTVPAPGGAVLCGAVAAVAVAGTVVVALPGTAGDDPDVDAGAVRVLSWNVHYGVSADPSVRLDEMVDVIASADPEVVVLQEVSRGWVLGGGGDMASALARATGRELAWAPAADRQFGNALLWDPDRADVTDVAVVELPYGAGPQRRSALAATVTVHAAPRAVPFRLVTTHLQHREENHATRLAQLDAIFAAEPVDGPYVLAGDLNAEPGWAEIAAITDEGLVSAQDAVGDPAALTSPAVVPRYRVDWVFSGPDVPATSSEVIDVVDSDHRPLLVTLDLP